MSDPNLANYIGEFSWFADKTLARVRKDLNWTWQQAQWTAAQDAYDAAIIADYGSIRIFGQDTPRPLRDIYTEVYVLDTLTAHKRYHPSDLETLIWEERAIAPRYGDRKPGAALIYKGPANRFFILGKPGAGKTTFLKYLAVREAQRGQLGRALGKTPIFISLKKYAESKQPLFDFIVAQFDVCHFPEAAPFVKALLKAGRALILFDGLDEVMDANAEQEQPQNAIAQELETFAKTYRECHVLITCRIAAVDRTFHESFTYLEMADFAPDQVAAFVQAWFAPPSPFPPQRVLDELNESDQASIRDLARNPLLLTLLCLAYEATGSLPARRVEIYQEAVDALLKKWDASRAIQRATQYRPLTLGRKEDMFARIAYDAMCRSQVIFRQDMLQQQLVNYVRHVPELPAAIDLDGEAILQEIIAQHGIFAQQSRDLYAFAHLTFQEYFAAHHIHRNLAATLPMVFANTANRRWCETILMTASLLPDATDFLRQFADALTARASKNPGVAVLLREIDQAVHIDPDVDPDRAPNLDPNPDPALDPARDRILALTLHLARAQSLAFAHDLALSLDRDFDGTFDRAVAFDRARSLALYRALALDRDFALDRDLARDRACSHALDLASDLDSAIASARDIDLNFDRDRALAFIRAFILAGGLAPQPDPDRDIARGRDIPRNRDIARILGLVPDRNHDNAHEIDDPDLPAAKLLEDYLRATQLFHACLQVAYTDQRRAFEARILEPPP